MAFRFWYVMDTAAHRLHSVRLCPRRLLGWVCDRLDLACGLTREEMARR